MAVTPTLFLQFSMDLGVMVDMSLKSNAKFLAISSALETW